MEAEEFMRILAETWDVDIYKAQKSMCLEKAARSIIEYVCYTIEGERISDEKIVEERIHSIIPLIDSLFEQVTLIPQGILAYESSLVGLGLKTGHLVTENPMDNWYEGPTGNPTQIYLYCVAPEELTYQMPDYLKEKRNSILESIGKKEFFL